MNMTRKLWGVFVRFRHFSGTDIKKPPAVLMVFNNLIK
jgi:hypothetical protein